MDTKKYKSRSIYIEHIKKAERYGKTINEYISYLEKLSVENKNKEVELELEKIKSLEETTKHLYKTLDNQRYMIDVQNKKIDSLIDTQQKLINAYAADIEFINELKKMVFKGE